VHEVVLCKFIVDADIYCTNVVVVVTKVTGHVLPVDILVRIGLSSVCDQLQELVRRIRTLRLDASEYTCLKFVILLNPGEAFVCNSSKNLVYNNI